MTTLDDKPKVEPGDFAWIERDWGPKIYKNQPYAKVSGCNRVLKDATTDFDISIWALARPKLRSVSPAFDHGDAIASLNRNTAEGFPQ